MNRKGDGGLRTDAPQAISSLQGSFIESMVDLRAVNAVILEVANLMHEVRHFTD
jgi:hypothetical protein